MSCFEDQSLTLGLGLPSSPKPKTITTQPMPNDVVSSDHRLEPSLTLSLSGETFVPRPDMIMITNNNIELLDHQHPPCSVVSAASSLSNSTATAAAPTTTVVSVKRERESASSDDLDMERACSRASDEEEDGSGPTTTRKKLRLSKDQSALLEESFKQHSTLNPKQKQALADRLNLRPRQVEVWFQNRRARTKLKQTEVDCEYLKKCCESLTDENRRLQKELQELKALKMTQPLYMHLPAATLTMCPSCERIGTGGVPIAAGGGPATSAKSSPFSMAAKPHFYSSFPNPSAAC